MVRLTLFRFNRESLEQQTQPVANGGDQPALLELSARLSLSVDASLLLTQNPIKWEAIDITAGFFHTHEAVTIAS